MPPSKPKATGPTRVLFIGVLGERFVCRCGRSLRRGMIVHPKDGDPVCSLACVPPADPPEE